MNKTFTERDLTPGKTFSMKFGGTCKIQRVAGGFVYFRHEIENTYPGMESTAPTHVSNCMNSVGRFLDNIIKEIE